MDPPPPKLVIILSGKRKSGKDYIADLLNRHIMNKVFLRISVPIKKQFTQLYGYNYEESLTESGYKESFRQDMITWSEQIRRQNPNCFLQSAIQDAGAHQYKVWILVDARRACDLNFFRSFQSHQSTMILTVRITASDEVRTQRGWIFTPGVDNVESECGLDHIQNWRFRIENNDLSEDELITKLDPIIKLANAVGR